MGLPVNERVATRISIGDGFRFGLGLMLAALLPWVVFVGVGLASAKWMPDIVNALSPAAQAKQQQPK